MAREGGLGRYTHTRGHQQIAKTLPRSTTTLSTSDTPLAEIAFRNLISANSWLLRRNPTGNGCSSIHQSNKSRLLIHHDIGMLEDEGSPSETSHNSSAGIISCSIICKTREMSPGHSRAARNAHIHMDKFISNSCSNIPAVLESAKLFWIKTTQQAYYMYYSSEFKTLKDSHVLSRLTAIIDHAGILRVGGRLQNSQLDADSKHPAILPK
jgi:hypothetical protein